MLRFTETRNYRWIAVIVFFILFAIGLQYMILAGPRPPAQSETIASDVSEVTDDFERVVDEIEYKLGLAPLPDDAEFHFPTWHYHYNDGYSYVEGYSEVVLNSNTPLFQYRARIQCSEPNTLYVSLLEGYYDYSFATENSPRGNVTRVTIYVNDDIRIVNEKVRVTDGSAIIPFSNLLEEFSKGVLIRVSLDAQVERFGWDNRSHSVIFDLQLFDFRWRECSHDGG